MTGSGGGIFKRVIRIALIATPPVMHLCACGLAALSGEGWNWIWIIIADFPLSYTLDKVSKLRLYNDELIFTWGLTVFGTAMWLGIGFALPHVLRWLGRALKWLERPVPGDPDYR